MSGRAVNWVWDNHGTKGSNLTVLLAIAKLSHRQSCPFKAYVSYDAIAKLTRLSERYVIDCVAELVAQRQLEITRESSGSRAHYYDILPDVWVNRGSVLSLNTCSPLQQRRASDNDVLMQETPASHADLQSTESATAPSVTPSNIIRYPKAKKAQRQA